MKRIKEFFSEFYNWYLTLLAVLVSLPILAPITLALGLTPIAKVIYFVYSFFCHQFATRSFHLFDLQFAWCSRDTGIWLGMFIAALLLKLNKVKGIRWYWVIPFVIPIALDGGIQTIFTMLNLSPSGMVTETIPYLSNNLTRFMTGSIFGIGISLWISNLMMAQVPLEQSAVEKKAKPKAKNFVKIMFLIIAMFPFYLGIIGIWDVTSNVYNPVAPIESVPKYNEDGFFIRRENGVCSINALENFLDLECFLGRYYKIIAPN